MENLTSLWPIALMFIVVYFLMIRPQKKKQKEQQDMLSALSTGDEVLTTGGIVGRILRVSETFLLLEVSAGQTLIVQKNAVASLLPKGSIDAMWDGAVEADGADEAADEAEAQPETAEPASQEPDRTEDKKEDAGKPGQTA